MTTRYGIVGLVLALAISMTGHARQGRAKVDVQRIENALIDAAASRNLVLEPNARRTIAQEIARQAAANPTNLADTKTPEMRAVEVLSVAERPGSAVITSDEARTRINDAKATAATATIDHTIDREMVLANKTLDAAARVRIRDDLQTQIDGLAKSGLPEEAITVRTEAYVKAVNVVLAGEPQTVTEGMYQRARDLLFDQLVNVDIESEPSGAIVTQNGNPIGPTNIKKKPFEPGKEYVLGFSLAGFEASTRLLYVSPGSDQNVREILKPAAPGQPPPPPPPSDPVPEKSFPFLLVFGALAGLALLVFLVSRAKG
jgi:hypothetical protein